MSSSRSRREFLGITAAGLASSPQPTWFRMHSLHQPGASRLK